mmetsp:Transcript_17162/g.26820  ORF Transcript_17162/g.26820 Transcript_17162/m.26820 type:complete len:120 (-) Transcript_17162:403-762(-)
MLETPPGGACTRVVGLSVMKFPQFWLLPVAYAFDDTRLSTGGSTFFVPGAGAVWTTFVLSTIGVGSTGCCCGGATHEAFGSWTGSVPKMLELDPPGGACTRVVGRSVSTFPAFWLLPEA